jgi:glycine dehydrogenase subunit 2
MCAFHGQMGMFVRAMAWMFSHGADGMRQASEDAVLNANYVRAGLRDVFTQPYGDKPCMHEVVFDDRFLKDTGVTTFDFAKAMIDEGFHPMTVYFPLVVRGAMLIEPTESESKQSLDQFIATLRHLADAARRGDLQRFRAAPRFAPRRRLDETKAAASTAAARTSPSACVSALAIFSSASLVRRSSVCFRVLRVSAASPSASSLACSIMTLASSAASRLLRW